MVKKFLLIFALFIGVVVAMTMNSESDWLTGIGRRAPALNLRDSGRALNLDSLRGEYVILNFWTSTDAASRVAANEYDAWVEDHPRVRVAFRSVNFDRSEGLYRATYALAYLLAVGKLALSLLELCQLTLSQCGG